jgi:glyoxylase-like metal-dependent hydrolase (beta-lactamase superfamily II)
LSPAANDVSTRQIGDLQASVVHAGLLHVPPAPAWKLEGSRYEIDEEGRPITGINGLVVQRDGAVVLVDPNSWTTGGTVKSKNAVMRLVPGPTVEESLAVLDLAAIEVTHVVITHGHWDHYTAIIDAHGQPRFPNAEHFFPAADWQAFVVENQRDDAALLRSYLDPLDAAGLLRLVTGDAPVTTGVTVLHTPGETPGHLVARFQASAGSLYYLGDLFHYPADFVRLDNVSAGRDAAEMLASRLRILEAIEAEGNATLVFTHGVFPAWGEVEREATWRWRYTI